MQDRKREREIEKEEEEVILLIEEYNALPLTMHTSNNTIQ